MFFGPAQRSARTRPASCQVTGASGNYTPPVPGKAAAIATRASGHPAPWTRVTHSNSVTRLAPRRGKSGFSLTELMVTLAAAGVLMGIAIPEFSALAAGQVASARINAIAGAVNSARHLAISHNTAATLCPGQGPVCGDGNLWHEGMLVFIDSDGDRRVDDGELVGARLPGLDAGETVVWRSFGNRSYLRFMGSGLTDWHPGNFQYCPADRDPRFARQVILNAQGRLRHAVDGDGDGIREDAEGRPLEC